MASRKRRRGEEVEREGGREGGATATAGRATSAAQEYDTIHPSCRLDATPSCRRAREGDRRSRSRNCQQELNYSQLRPARQSPDAFRPSTTSTSHKSSPSPAHILARLVSVELLVHLALESGSLMVERWRGNVSDWVVMLQVYCAAPVRHDARLRYASELLALVRLCDGAGYNRLDGPKGRQKMVETLRG